MEWVILRGRLRGQLTVILKRGGTSGPSRWMEEEKSKSKSSREKVAGQGE